MGFRYFGRNSKGQSGIFPVTYVQRIESPPAAAAQPTAPQNQNTPQTQRGFTVSAAFKYKAVLPAPSNKLVDLIAFV